MPFNVYNFLQEAIVFMKDKAYRCSVIIQILKYRVQLDQGHFVHVVTEPLEWLMYQSQFQFPAFKTAMRMGFIFQL